MKPTQQNQPSDTVIVYVLRRMRLPLITLIVVFSVAMLGLVLIPATDAAGQSQHLSFFDAFYFVSFTATTIGFGELPYPFNPAQRFWVILMMYPAVIAWLYAFGTILTLMQDKTFQQALTESAYSRHVRRIRSPFYLVCGYGDTGHILVRSLIKRQQQVVIIDMDHKAINDLKIEDLSMFVPGLGADAAQAEQLIKAGITHPKCIAVVAVTDNDQVNLKVAISSKLLNPHVPIACRTESASIKSNMASFGTDHIINAFDIFATHLALFISSHAHFTLQRLLVDGFVADSKTQAFPEDGTWVICGFGRMGKAVAAQLEKHGVSIQVIEADPTLNTPPQGAIIGPATEAIPLLEAGVAQAVGIVAATADDADNLSIIMTARALNPKLFIVARQNIRANDPLFAAANIDMVMQGNKIVAHQAMTSLATPLLELYLKQSRRDSISQVQAIIHQLTALIGEQQVDAWQVNITPQQTPAVCKALAKQAQLSLAQLMTDSLYPDDILPMIPLLVSRGEGQYFFHPEPSFIIQDADRILFCGDYDQALHASLYQYHALIYSDNCTPVNA